MKQLIILALTFALFSSQLGDYIPFHTAYCDFCDND